MKRAALAGGILPVRKDHRAFLVRGAVDEVVEVAGGAGEVADDVVWVECSNAVLGAEEVFRGGVAQFGWNFLVKCERFCTFLRIFARFSVSLGEGHEDNLAGFEREAVREEIRGFAEWRGSGVGKPFGEPL